MAKRRQVYKVVGVYADNNQRYATFISAATPAQAEKLVVKAIERDGQELIVAAVIDADCKIVR